MVVTADTAGNRPYFSVFMLFQASLYGLVGVSKQLGGLRIVTLCTRQGTTLAQLQPENQLKVPIFYHEPWELPSITSSVYAGTTVNLPNFNGKECGFQLSKVQVSHIIKKKNMQGVRNSITVCHHGTEMTYLTQFGEGSAYRLNLPSKSWAFCTLYGDMNTET